MRRAEDKLQCKPVQQDLSERYSVSCACQWQGGVSTCISSQHKVTSRENDAAYTLVRVQRARMPTKSRPLPSLTAAPSREMGKDFSHNIAPQQSATCAVLQMK